MEKRLIEIEARIAFMDRMVEELNQALISQQRQLDQMEKILSEISQKFREMTWRQDNAADAG